MEPDKSEAYEMGYKIGEAVGGLIGCAIVILIPALFVISLIMAIVKLHIGWVIATVIFGLIGLVGVGAVFYLGLRSQDAFGGGASSGSSSSMVTKDNLASIEVPSYWKEQSLGNEESSLDAGNMFRGELLIILSEGKVDFAEGTTLTEYAELVMEQMRTVMDESGEYELSQLEVGGRPALETPLEAVIDKVKFSYLVTLSRGRSTFIK